MGKIFALDSTKPILCFVDGIEKTPDMLTTLNPSEIKSITVLKGKSGTDLYGDRAKNGVIIILTKAKSDAPIAINAFYQDSTWDKKKNGEYEKTFTKVEEPASFPGGMDGWRNYLVKNLQYPETAQKQKIQGVVRVQLVVDKQGHVSDVKAINNPGGGLAEEAERVIKTGPNWMPAKQNGKLVTYRFVQTLTFQLQ
jgi:TonB family protein